MRARDLIFHVDCFSCSVCGSHLNAGDTAAVRRNRIFCGLHSNIDLGYVLNCRRTLAHDEHVYYTILYTPIHTTLVALIAMRARAS